MRRAPRSAIERPAAARLGWCAALAFAAHGVFAFGALSLAPSGEQHAPQSPTALALLPVDLEMPAHGASSSEEAALELRSSAQFSGQPLRRARAPLAARHAAVARSETRTPALDSGSTEPLPMSSGDTAGASPSAALFNSGAGEQAGAGDRVAGSDRGTTAGFAGGQGGAHGPRLRVRRPCRGLFPASANEDVGVVTLALQVGREGGALGARILDEHPRGQGFARAALSCVPSLSFEPATRDDGTRTAATSTVRLRFVRHL